MGLTGKNDFTKNDERSADVDVARTEMVEAELSAFVNRRDRERRKTEGERPEEAAWRESERRHQARRREENRWEWGTPLPDLETMGLAKKMKPLAALIEEQDRLRRRAQDLGYEQQRLQEQIKRLEDERTAAWGRAMRSGEEAPSEEAIEEAKNRLEDVGREISAVRYAGDLVDAETRQTAAEHAAEWDAEVRARGEKILEEALRMADALSAKLAETEGLAALHGWLTSGGMNYTPPTPATISVDAILHERRRALGVLEPEVVG
jgi:hypothetical protein